MELKPNMYVRTKRDGIGRIISLSIGEEDECCFIELSNRRTGIKEHNIVKASHNIIDLIEVGDFITLGEKNYPLQVRNIWEFAGDINIELSNGAKFEDLHNDKDFKIYSIVTKEQFEAMQYKVV